jgi:hypothetical protein
MYSCRSSGDSTGSTARPRSVQSVPGARTSSSRRHVLPSRVTGSGNRCGPCRVSGAMPAQLPVVRDTNPSRKSRRQVTATGFRPPKGASGRNRTDWGSSTPVSWANGVSAVSG